MSTIKLSDNVYSVGVQNPGLRVFDIIMESKYGTTYNAYLITGKKNVLVETVHYDFFDEYLYNLQSLIDINDIDYIIMNHTEPDHSGSLIRLLEINPNITVICTIAAKNNIKSIINREFNCQVVKHGDSLDIGNTSLKFIVAPLLHWPDSMMTYHPDDKVLFTCDFLGCHFCDSSITNENLHYPDKYLQEFKYYFDGIFGPFKPYVLAGIDKIKDLEIKVVCPSHGPILVKDIDERINDYKKWSTTLESKEKTAVILYASAYGYTKKLAKAGCDAINRNTNIKAEAIDVVLTPISEFIAKVNNANCILVGSCTINRDAPKIIWDILSSIDAMNTKNKVASAFGSYGWTGEAVPMIMNRLRDLKYNVVGEGFKSVFNPTSEDLENFGSYALNVVDKIK